MTAQGALNKIGAAQAGLVQSTIGKSKEWAEPNADSTINGLTYEYKRDGVNSKTGKAHKKGDIVQVFKGKGSDVPLIDTGQLRQSVHYVIEPKGGGD